MNGQCIITKPADPEKLRAYQLKVGSYKPKIKLDKMGRKKRENNGMSLETARYITDQRIGKMLYNRFK
jgi:hypothetical protein